MAIADYYSLGSHKKKRVQLATFVSLTAAVVRTRESVLPKNDGVINRLLRFSIPIKGDWQVQMHSGIRQ